MRTGAYPGSFDPPTVAHLAVAEAAVAQAGLDRLDLVVSEVALGKPRPHGLPVPERLEVLAALGASRPWLGARVTAAQLLVEVADGYDVLVLGADKWAQVLDPAWYGSEEARDEALRRLPPVLVAPRPPAPMPEPSPPAVRHLDLDGRYGEVSSTAVRAGRIDWMAAEAAASGRWPPGRGAPGGRGSRG